MSLINDALKKAQKQRTGEVAPLASMPGIGGEPAAKIAKRAKPVGFNTLLTRIGLAAGGLVGLLIGVYALLHFLNRPAALTPPAAAPQPAVTVAAKPATPPAPGTPAATPDSSIVFKLPVVTPPVEDKTPAAPAETIHVVETKPAAAVAVAPVVAAPPAPAAKMSSKAITYIESLRIAGIRASTTDSKVLMNDRVYRTGDIVEHELGLKLTGITSSSLAFEDEQGARYIRNF